jgi:lysophospholipase L1-like esterase
MAPYKVVRRAYGGAKYCDLAIHTPKLIDGLRFRAAMIFVGNDITGNEKDKTPEEVARLAKIVMDSVRQQRRDTQIFLIAVTPSPSRFQHWPKIVQANRAFENLAANEANTLFVSTQDKYLNSQNEPRAELFVKDMLHQNSAGYAIWSSILKDSLNQNLRN